MRPLQVSVSPRITVADHELPGFRGTTGDGWAPPIPTSRRGAPLARCRPAAARLKRTRTSMTFVALARSRPYDGALPPPPGVTDRPSRRVPLQIMRSRTGPMRCDVGALSIAWGRHPVRDATGGPRIGGRGQSLSGAGDGPDRSRSHVSTVGRQLDQPAKVVEGYSLTDPHHQRGRGIQAEESCFLLEGGQLRVRIKVEKANRSAADQSALLADQTI